jgi:phage protein D
MDLRALERVYSDFYVPAFSVKIGGEDLVQDLFLAVTGVKVDLKEKAAGHFSFTVANAFDWEAREFVARRSEERVDLLELFAFGAPVEIALGYGDRSTLPVILTGIITELATAFGSSGAPELNISGFDGLYPLTIGKRTRNWEDAADSKAVSDVTSDHNLSAMITETRPVKPRIDQNEESDLAFIEKLAERNGATFYMRNDRFYFGPRRNDTTEVVELVWGEGLVSFSPEANLAKQITEVEVHGWSATDGEAIVGRASRGDESGRDTRAESGADRLASALSTAPVLRVRAAVHTQEEADARAKAILEERAQDFVTGTGDCIGIPAIVPDVNIALGGMGRGFSKTYYVSEATHSIDASGYHTNFKVQETTV